MTVIPWRVEWAAVIMVEVRQWKGVNQQLVAKCQHKACERNLHFSDSESERAKHFQYTITQCGKNPNTKSELLRKKSFLWSSTASKILGYWNVPCPAHELFAASRRLSATFAFSDDADRSIKAQETHTSKTCYGSREAKFQIASSQSQSKMIPEIEVTLMRILFTSSLRWYGKNNSHSQTPRPFLLVWQHSHCLREENMLLIDKMLFNIILSDCYLFVRSIAIAAWMRENSTRFAAFRKRGAFLRMLCWWKERPAWKWNLLEAAQTQIVLTTENLRDIQCNTQYQYNWEYLFLLLHILYVKRKKKDKEKR